MTPTTRTPYASLVCWGSITFPIVECKNLNFQITKFRWSVLEQRYIPLSLLVTEWNFAFQKNHARTIRANLEDRMFTQLLLLHLQNCRDSRTQRYTSVSGFAFVHFFGDRKRPLDGNLSQTIFRSELGHFTSRIRAEIFQNG